MAAQEAPGAAAGGNQVMRWRYGDVGDSNFRLHGRSVPLLVGLLLAIAAFVALCLYLRWRCHRYVAHDPEAADSSPSSAAAAATLPGLDANAIRALPVTLYSRPAATAPPRVAGNGGEVDDDDQAAVLCSICISKLVAGEKVKTLPPCGHCFHPDCVDAWLRSQASCPLCRTLLVASAAGKPDVNGNDDAV